VRAKRGQGEVHPSLPSLYPHFTLSLPSLCPLATQNKYRLKKQEDKYPLNYFQKRLMS